MKALNYIPDQPSCYPMGSRINVMQQADEILSEFITDKPKTGHENLIIGIERETQLVINQLSRLKGIHKKAKEKLLLQECQISNDLNRLNPLGDGSSSPLDPNRIQLKARLALLDDKRQKLDFDFFDRHNRCLEKLVALTNKHKLLKPAQ